MYVQAWLSSLKLFWITCSLFTILLWSCKLTNTFIDLASFCLSGDDPWHCPSAVRQHHNPALFNPHFHTIIQLCKKATRGSVPRDLVDIFPGQSMPSPQGTVLLGNCCSNGEINTRQSKAATIRSPWEAQLSCPGLYFWSNVSCCTWLFPGLLQTLLQGSFSLVVQAGSCLHTGRASGSLAQVISCTV